MAIIALLIGAALGAMVGRRFDAMMLGALVGFIIGYLLDARRKTRPSAQHARGTDAADPLRLLDPRVAAHLRAMERRIAGLEAALQNVHSADEESERARAGEPLARPIATERSMTPSPIDEREAAQRAETDARIRDERFAMPARGNVARPSSVPAYARTPAATASAPAGNASPLRQWITGGNTLARTGVVVLFIGVAFLLKYATEHVTIPIEARLAGVALGGFALLALGWRLRNRRAGYAMTLQGAGIGILYMTVFAGLRLYSVLPPTVAFALLLVIGALSAALAIRQDAMPLAVLGVLGGFAAPLLASSDGSHVMLFSYYALLNAAILAIAWFKAWRLLNVVGFACTVAVGTLWGITTYRPADFATTEPFLILFFLFYVAIATLYALRRSLELRRYVDATLVFGVPLVAAGWQNALAHPIEYGLAWSAVAASAIYALLARVLMTKGDLRLLVDAFAALGVVFATLAVPLALDARLTSATWALEGAALVWMGARQARRSARVFGLLLQLAGGFAFALGFSLGSQRWVAGSLPVLNSDFLGAMLVAAGGLVSSRVLSRATVTAAWERSLAPVVFGWGVAWWLGAGWHEIDRFVGADARMAVLVVFLAGSAAFFAAIAAAFQWPLSRVPAMGLPAALVALALVNIVGDGFTHTHLLAHGGVVAWPLALIVEMLLLRHFEHALPPAKAGALDFGHANVVWLVTLVVAHELAWLARTNVSGADWRLVPWAVVPGLTLIAIARLTARDSWPFGARASAYLHGGAVPVAAIALLWTLYANVQSAGDFAPWPFVPLANPLDVAQVLVFVGTTMWLQRMRRADRDKQPAMPAGALGVAAAALLLVWVTCSTLRTVHHAADVPWSLAALWASRVVQAALSLVWSLAALAAMVIAHRRGYRVAWLAGAALLGIVVAKLFAVDLSQVGGVERIVSFIGVGALLLVVGYLAPVPPRQQPR